jgi:hypothetical protein
MDERLAAMPHNIEASPSSPCISVPHRGGRLSLSASWSRDLLQGSTMSAQANWLHENGPTHYVDCEPANAALSEGVVDVDAHPFTF